MTEHRPPGEPPAAALEDELADLVVVDGPNAGEVWTYVADAGGYVRVDATEDTICTDTAAVIAHAGGNVRPASDDREAGS
jgi:hypothetical protein